MAIQIKSSADAAKKFVSRAQGAGADYKAGVGAPRRSWAGATAAAESSWQQGVSQAASQGRFGKGVQKAGDAKWQRKASDVGSQRYGQGVAAAQTDYQQNVDPYFQVIAGLNLQPRGPKGDPNNNNRSLQVQQALRQKKVSG